MRIAEELRADPGSSIARFRLWLRERLLDIWRSRGGGFYGLGYVMAFVYFEIDMFAGDLATSSSLGTFAGGQALELIFRLSILSFVNVLQALIWPVFVLERFGAPGIMLLIGAYVTFEHFLKPGIERVFPELKEHREHRQAKKREKQKRKRSKKRSTNEPGEDPSRNRNP